MSSTDSVQQDPLLLLRQSIAANSSIIPTTSAEPPSDTSNDVSLATATHLYFSSPAPVSLPLNTSTRFISSDTPVDLRSIYFAWLKREVAIPEYNASALALNAELGDSGKVQNLAFVERLDLITWLEGASEESEYIKPFAADTAAAAASVRAPTTAGGAAQVSGSGAGRLGKSIDPRLAEIYNGERRTGDRNSVLRGIKATDFSHVRKMAAPLISRKPHHPIAGATTTTTVNTKTPQRRPDPIILLSPSASSLLRMSNIKSFLESGVYVPPDSSLSTSSSSASILHISRMVPSIDPNRPIRFLIVDTPEKFKPEYWQLVVAVFTTGQAWQFKSYKWQQPAELFRHTLGLYVGWRGDNPPETVKGWGRGVMSTAVEKWNSNANPSSRWRDREVVENIWKAIEENMRNRGWRRDAGPAAR